MKTVKYFLKNRAFTHLLLVLILAGGLFSYFKMGKLEDAPFTIKQAVVITQYPGASPMEVQTQISDILEESILSIGEVDYVKSENRAGLSKIDVYIKKETRAPEMQQLWDNLRRKVNDVQAKLPPGAHNSIVNDDFGDVLGVFYGLHGNTVSYRELEDQATIIKNDLLKVKDVKRVQLYGIQHRTIEIIINPSFMAQAGITSTEVAYAIKKQNKVVDGGALEVNDQRIRIESTGSFTNIEEIENLTIVSRSGEYFKLKEIAQVKESYLQPAISKMKVNNSSSVGIAISTVSTGNVVEMAELVEERIAYFQKVMPEKFQLTAVYDQGHESAVANDGFILNLIISVITVVVILLLFIGFKNGLLVGSGLVFSIFATLIFMYTQNIALQRMSLGAIIIAMGMLVDNAIVVSDSVLVNMERGMRKRASIMRAISSTAIPLLAATAIAILTFLPIYLSPHQTGELLSSLFIVIAVSLFFSWIFALVQTPFYIELFVRRPRKEDINNNLYQGKVYVWFRRSLEKIIHRRHLVIGIVVLLLGLSIYGFKFIPNVFLPQLDKQYFTVYMWMPEGTRFETMEQNVEKVSDYIDSFEETTMVSTFIGQTPPRYYLTNASLGPQPNFGQCLVKTQNLDEALKLQNILRTSLRKEFPNMFMKVNSFELTTCPEALVEGRFYGQDVQVLDSLTNLAIAIMHKNPKVEYARNEWGNMTPIIKAEYDPIRAGQLHISKDNILEGTKAMSDGLPVGVYRDNNNKVPVILKSTEIEGMGIKQMGDYSIWNGKQSAPLSQVSKNLNLDWEYSRVRTYNRALSMSAMCEPKYGYTMTEVQKELSKEIDKIKLPQGYSFYWDSQYKDQKEAQAAIATYFPLAFLLIILILVAIFRNYKQPLIILLILPLSLIGVVFGLLITGFDFGFLSIAGWLGLLGMIIKNVIVLIDEINEQRKQGKPAYDAVIESTVSRARPVLMAAITTIFGMVPLLFDVAFGSMAATIVFGLAFATFLTLFVTPALYAIFYKIKR
jgi:multidrug efflux pump subunit AcrB